MTSQDQYHDASGVSALDSQTISTDTTTAGNTVDLLGYKACTFYIQSGTLTDGAYATKLQESDDDSTWADVAAANQMGSPSFAATDDDAVKRIGYAGKKRYCRLAIVSTSTSSGGVFSAIAVKGAPEHMPVADD
jgi:hypothetical protein